MTGWTGRAARFVAGARTARGRRALRHGVAATVEHQPMLRRLRPRLVVDVGANRGQFALDVLAACPHADVISFEPLAGESAVFRAVLGDVRTVRLVEAALSDASGRRSIHVAGRADSSSLLEPTELQTRTFAGTAEVRTETVDVTTLDEALEETLRTDLPSDALLKIDVQGHELDVLRGGASVLERFRWVFVEVSFVELYDGQPLADEIIAHLATRGFAVVDTGVPTRRAGRTVQIDLLFERR